MDNKEKISVKGVNAWFCEKQALFGITMPVYENKVTAIIGPSGCGKSTFVRCINRMHDTIPGASSSGEIVIDGENILSCS